MAGTSANILSVPTQLSQQVHPTGVGYKGRAKEVENRTASSAASLHSATTLSMQVPLGGIKRRLGMGRTTSGYPSKRFKPPTE